MSNGLSGACVVNTRALHQAPELDVLLLERGATPLSYPCLAIEPPADTSPLDEALRQLLAGQFDWLVLTSTNAVSTIVERLTASGHRLSDRPMVKIAAVGSATAAATVAHLGTTASFVSAEGSGNSLAQELPVAVGERVLMPVSEIARSEPASILRARSAIVTSVVGYRTVTGSGGVDLPGLLKQGEIDAITFTSPSAVSGCLTRLAAECETPADLTPITIVTIGPTTDLEAKSHGLMQTTMSPSPSLLALVETLDRTLAVKQFQGGEAWLSRSSA